MRFSLARQRGVPFAVAGQDLLHHLQPRERHLPHLFVETVPHRLNGL